MRSWLYLVVGFILLALDALWHVILPPREPDDLPYDDSDPEFLGSDGKPLRRL